MLKTKNSGFTIVELLIVIVVIAILAAISIVAYNGIQDRSRNSKISNDISAIRKAIQLARHDRSQVLNSITGSTASGQQCWSKADGTNLASLPITDSCISNYITAMNRISSASGVSGLSDLRDPWGRPYLIDENEGEGGNCNRDTIAVYKLPFTTGFGVHGSTPIANIPLSGFSGCA